jgi:hypothetical protein
MLQLHSYQPHLRCRSRPSVQFHRSNIMCPHNKIHISGLFCELSKPFKHVHHETLLPTQSFFPSGLPTNTPYAPLLSPLHVTCPAHLILLDLITRINIFVSSTEKQTPHYIVIIKFRDVTLTLWTLALILSDNISVICFKDNCLTLTRKWTVMHYKHFIIFPI